MIDIVWHCEHCGLKHEWKWKCCHVVEGPIEMECDECKAKTRLLSDGDGKLDPAPSDQDIINAMAEHGGEFAKELASLWKRADSVNRERIKQAWSELFAKYIPFVQSLK
jgi:hypothetical protein